MFILRRGRFAVLSKQSLRLSKDLPLKEVLTVFLKTGEDVPEKRIIEGINKIFQKYPRFLEYAMSEQGRGLCVHRGDIGDPGRFGFNPPVRLDELITSSKLSTYTDSVGQPKLRSEVRHRNPRIKDGNIVTDFLTPEEAKIVVGAGSSSIVRTYIDIVGGGNRDLILFCPELIYPLFLAEGANRSANMITIPIDRSTGTVDLHDLECRMDKAMRRYGHSPRYMYVTTSIGNPLGSAVSKSQFEAETTMLNDLERQHDDEIRIHRITDPTYEFLRRGSDGFDPIEVIQRLRKGGYELVTRTFSKKEAIAGDRIGVGTLLTPGNGTKGSKRREEAFGDLDSNLAITLGLSANRIQAALATYLRETRTDVNAFNAMAAHDGATIREMHARVDALAHELESSDLVWLHPYYYPNGRGSVLDLSGRLNSFYILFKFKLDRVPIPQSSMFLAWTFWKAVNEFERYGEQTTPIFTVSDGDMFYILDFRSKVPQYIRVVALFNEEQRNAFMEQISDFNERVIQKLFRGGSISSELHDFFAFALSFYRELGYPEVYSEASSWVAGL